VRGAKAVFLVICGALGALFALGCALAALFELQGFGGDSDAGPRSWYLMACGLGVLACLLVPLALWRAVLPDTAPAVPWLVVGGSAVVIVALLGFAGLR
jgi:hypothetical protein